MDIDRPTLTFITVIAALVGGWAAWSAAKAGNDAASVGGVVYALVAGALAKVFGGSSFAVVFRSVFLIVGGVFALVASVLLGSCAGIRLTPTTH
ncbi:hypothetical protein ABZ135_32830 [Streptomyces sp. NPDC006339]|uniref:hypothetical protein n=1 Tax=Streptomyces sp. NPDC006339 TaxID=3156755 RepID=UPI0033ADD04C